MTNGYHKGRKEKPKKGAAAKKVSRGGGGKPAPKAPETPKQQG